MKNNLLKNSWVALVIALLAVSPAFAYAKSNGKNGDNEKKNQAAKVKVEKIERESESKDDGDDNDRDNDKKENKLERKCLTAYGHLFAFGWLKKNTAPEIDMDCFLPFGIAKKFKDHNGTASSTPDTVAPAITDLRAEANVTSAVITWNTNEKADSAVFWSLTSPVNTSSTSPSQIFVGNKVKNHSLTINGLAASTTYYVVVISKDAAGNTATSSELSFTTKPVVIIGDITAPTISSVVAMIGTSTAKVGWQTNEPATSKVYFGTSTPLSLTASSTSFVESLSLVSAHLVQVNGLGTSTTYYMVVESKDGAGNTQRTSEFSFTTGS